MERTLASAKWYRLSDDVAYRIIDNELVLIESESGFFYYFEPETKAFFEAMESPVNLEGMLDPNLLVLIRKKILVPCEQGAGPAKEGFTFPKILQERDKPSGSVPTPHILRARAEAIREASFFY